MATAEEIGVRALANLAAQAERNRQAGAGLLEEIRTLMAAHPGPRPLSASQVRALLLSSLDTRIAEPKASGRTKSCVSVRRIQQILRMIRETSSVFRTRLRHDRQMLTKVSSPHGPGQFPGPINPATLPQPIGPAANPTGVPAYLGTPAPMNGPSPMVNSPSAQGRSGRRTPTPQEIAAVLSQFRAAVR